MKYQAPRLKSAKMYYSISEVSDMTGIKPHVLRYWETEFPTLKPKKNRAGNRNYQQKDIKAILVIKELLYKEKFTINGARKQLQKHYGNPDPLLNQLHIPFADPHARQILATIRKELEDLKDLLSGSSREDQKQQRVSS